MYCTLGPYARDQGVRGERSLRQARIPVAVVEKHVHDLRDVRRLGLHRGAALVLELPRVAGEAVPHQVGLHDELERNALPTGLRR